MDYIAAKSSVTREGLMRSIRYRDDRGKFSKIPPAVIQVWENLLGDWPSITSGGPRFILQVRMKFLHQCETLKDAEISWDESYKMKPMDEDDIYYALFSMDPNGMISDIIWENELESDRLGLHRFAPIQSNLLEFDPARISDYRVIAAQCRRRGLPQRGAILEWARLNPGYIPDFILQMYHNLEFQVWFKSYYDTLRLMFKRLIEDDLPFIPDLEDELKTNFEL